MTIKANPVGYPQQQRMDKQGWMTPDEHKARSIAAGLRKGRQQPQRCCIHCRHLYEIHNSAAVWHCRIGVFPTRKYASCLVWTAK